MSTDAPDPTAVKHDAYAFTVFNSFSAHSVAGPYRAADYWELEEGAPIELIRGRLTLSPSPLPSHQVIAHELANVLCEAEKAGGGVCILSPMDVVLDDQTILQPDVLYLAADRLAQLSSRVDGPPSLVVEVLSPGTGNRDRQEKLDLYAQHGVPEYWIVDPDARVVQFLVNDEGRYVVTTPSDNAYASPVTGEIRIDLAAFWAEVDRRLPKGAR